MCLHLYVMYMLFPYNQKLITKIIFYVGLTLTTPQINYIKVVFIAH